MSDHPRQEIAALFTALPYFSSLDAPVMRAVTQAASRHRFDANQIVLLEGEPCHGLYILEEGWLKVSKTALDGREQTLHFLGRAEAFNAIGVFTGTPNPATVTALEPSTVWLIPRAQMLRLLETHPALARAVIQDLAGRVLHLIALVEDLSLRRVESRMARLLLEAAQGNTIQRQRWATQTEMAARLGTVPDVVSRTVRKLVELNILQVSRSEISILDRPQLEALAAMDEPPRASESGRLAR